MSEETGLTTVGNETGLAPVGDVMNMLPDSPDQKVFDDTVGSYDNLPYIILLQPAADLAKPPHNQKHGDYYLMEQDKFTSLGEEFDALMLGWRLRAMAYNADEVLSCHDAKDPLFDEYRQKAEAKVKDTHRYLWGPEYLIYIPKIDKYASFFFNNKTLQRAAKEQVHAYLKKQVTFKHHWIEKNEYSWWGLLAVECLNPVDAIDLTKAQSILQKFLDPPKRVQQAGSPFASKEGESVPTSVDGESR